MKTSSGKAKGRRLQQLVANTVSKLLGIPWGADELIRSREMGQSGVDVVLIGKALKKFPWSIECKNAENWSMHQWIQQAKDNRKENTNWLLICGRNRTEPVVTLTLSAFMNLYQKYLQTLDDNDYLRNESNINLEKNNDPL